MTHYKIKITDLKTRDEVLKSLPETFTCDSWYANSLTAKYIIGMQYLHIPIMEDGKLALSNFCPNMDWFATSCHWASYSWHDKPYTNYAISDDGFCEFDSAYDLCLDASNVKIIL